MHSCQPDSPSPLRSTISYYSTDHKLIAYNGKDKLDWLELISPIDDKDNLVPGELFHMDFGFPWGKVFHMKVLQGRIITSIDGYYAYLLIIDSKTLFICVMLAKHKKSPTDFLQHFFALYGNKTSHCLVCTDKGGKLWGSFTFRDTVLAAGYLIQPTAPDAPFQNAMAE